MEMKKDSRPIECGVCIERLDDYIHGRLGETEMRETADHLGSCAACAEKYAARKRYIDALRETGKIPRDLHESIMNAVGAEKRRTRIRRILMTAVPAAAAAVLFIALLPGIIGRTISAGKSADMIQPVGANGFETVFAYTDTRTAGDAGTDGLNENPEGATKSVTGAATGSAETRSQGDISVPSAHDPEYAMVSMSLGRKDYEHVRSVFAEKISASGDGYFVLSDISEEEYSGITNGKTETLITSPTENTYGTSAVPDGETTAQPLPESAAPQRYILVISLGE